MVADHMTTLSPTIMVVAAGFMVWGGGGVGGGGERGVGDVGGWSDVSIPTSEDEGCGNFYNGPGLKTRLSPNLFRTKYA